MEQLGFELSPIVKDASIQKNRLRHDLEVMQKLIDQYNSMLEKMDKADVRAALNIHVYLFCIYFVLFIAEKKSCKIRFIWKETSIFCFNH